ncbi:hypothetical protein EI94DRAFT_337425 [Lactarius quietus]|nr:hypothetical protein EI94DRAFT_337425 [Lactarius quietus]
MSNLLPNPRIGSANPSASLSALWGYIQPALDHIIRSPVYDPSKVPAVDVNYHIGIHTALYNYFTNHASSLPAPHLSIADSKVPSRAIPASTPLGCDVYGQLDAYLADVAREVLLQAPTDDSALLHYLVPRFTRYSAGAQSINRLLNYVNRQYVRRAVDEDRGWLRIDDIVSEVAEGAPSSSPAEALGPGGAALHRKITEKMRERRTAELRRWGAPDGATAEQLAQAEACAKAASALDRVVPVLSLAYRRFRTDVLEPLLVVPKAKARGKKKGGGAGRASAVVPSTGDERAAVGPRGRLARAVKGLLESKGDDGGEWDTLASDTANMLMRTGIRPDHPLRRRLRKHCMFLT